MAVSCLFETNPEVWGTEYWAHIAANGLHGAVGELQVVQREGIVSLNRSVAVCPPGVILGQRMRAPGKEFDLQIANSGLEMSFSYRIHRQGTIEQPLEDGTPWQVLKTYAGNIVKQRLVVPEITPKLPVGWLTTFENPADLLTLISSNVLSVQLYRQAFPQANTRALYPDY